MAGSRRKGPLKLAFVVVLGGAAAAVALVRSRRLEAARDEFVRRYGEA
jgi:hypothetical protein